MISRDLTATLLDALDRGAIVELASDLIRIPSVNPQDAADCRRLGISPGELELAEMKQEYLQQIYKECTQHTHKEMTGK